MSQQIFQLTVKKGPSLGKKFELSKDKITIGRDANHDITFDIKEVSRKHASIVRRGNEYFVQDLGSTNGTFVNKKEVKGQYHLQPGDVVMLSDDIYMEFGAQYDPDATMVAPPSFSSEAEKTEYALPKVSPSPAPSPPSPPPSSRPSSAPSPRQSNEQYAGRIPASPEVGPDFLDEEDENKKTWLWAGLGCLAIVIFLVVVGVVLFDALNLYCTPPFDKLFSFLYTCP